MASISLVTFAGQTVTSQDDALVYESALGDGGIIYGAQVTLKSANTLHISSGHGVIAGRKFTVYESDIPIPLSSAGNLLGRLYIHMDLSNASEPIEILSETGNSLTPLRQDANVNVVNGVFEFNIATFTVGTATISNLRNVYPRIQYANSGSFITIKTLEPSLIGQEVQITDGESVIYAIFDANGEAELKNVFMTGDLNITATDGTYEAGTSINIPYYGSYTVNLAFWLATLNITTASSELYNQQITVTNSSQEVVGTTTFNSSGVANFIVNAPDTYTLSIVSGGNTYTTSVIVSQQTTYNIQINAGFVWSEWVTQGGLDASNYNSLADVFADEVALYRLMTVHASCDYLIEAVSDDINTINDFCANDNAMKWIGLRDYVCDGLTAINGVEAKFLASEYWERYLKDHVPTMTSNTAPYGVASGTSDGSNAWRAFNGTNESGSTDAWGGSGVNIRLAMEFPTPICVKEFEITNRNNSTVYAVKDFTLQGSNDGTNWTDLGNYAKQDGIANKEKFSALNNDYYKMYGIYVTSVYDTSSAKYSRVGQLQFYGRSLNVSVPKMTSNNAPFYEVGATSQQSVNYAPWKAFDKDLSTSNDSHWSTAGAGAPPQRIWCDFKMPVVAKFAYIKGCVLNEFKEAKLQGSNDGNTWVDIGSIEATSNYQEFFVSLVNDTPYRYYGCEVTRTNGANNVCLVELQFYGLDYSEREFEPNSGKKWLYDHGLELESFTTSGAVTKGSDYLTLSAANSEATATVDLTNYSILRCKVGDHMSGTTQLKAGSVANANLTDTNAPNNESLDVSNVNQSIAAGVGMTASGICDITEIWAE